MFSFFKSILDRLKKDLSVFGRPLEKLLVFSLFLMICTVCFVSLYQSRRFSLAKTEKMINVSILGEVKKPGVYEVADKTPLKELFALAKAKKHANLQKFDLQLLLKNGDQIQVERLEVIRLTLEGAVLEPGMVEMPVGTRVCDLKKIVSLREDFDKSFFKSRRELRDGEVVKIPSIKNH